MNPQGAVLVFKVMTMVTWLTAAAAFLFPAESTFGQIGRALFMLLFCVHAVECVAFFNALKRTGRPLLMELANTLFFGVVHYAEVRAILASQDAQPTSESAEDA